MSAAGGRERAPDMRRRFASNRGFAYDGASTNAKYVERST